MSNKKYLFKEDFFEVLDFIKNLCSIKANIKNKKGTKIFRLKFGGIIQSEKFFNYLYENSNIFLFRKIEKFRGYYAR
jgi:hypothetical protein